MRRFTGWYRFVRGLVRDVFFRAGGGFRVIGVDRVPLDGPLIVAPNHTSHADPPAIACSLPRQIAFMAKKELFGIPIFGTLIKSLGSFPIKRGAADMEAVRVALQLLESGKALLVFPEGTRGDSKTLGTFNRGVALLAKRSEAQVIPVGIVGTHRKLPRGKSFPRWGPVTVEYGIAFRYAEVAGSGSESEQREAFSRALEAKILELCSKNGLELKTSESSLPTKEPRPGGEASEHSQGARA